MKPLNLLAFLLGLSLPFLFISPVSAYVCGLCPAGETPVYGNPAVVRDHVYIANCSETSAPVEPCSSSYSVVECDWYTANDHGGSGDMNDAWQTITTYYKIGCEGSEPATCSNGTKDGDEIGIDCGGECTSACVNACPEGSYLVGSHCYKSSEANAFGQCPSGYSRSVTASGLVSCSKNLGSVTFASQDYLDENPLDPAPNDDFSKGTFSVVQSSETVTDNGDGTETATVTTVNSDGSSSSTSVTRPSGSATGTGFTSGVSGSTGVAAGYSGETSGETSVEDNPENYNFDNSYGDSEFDGSVSDEDMPEQSDIAQLLLDFRDSFPLFSAINNVGATFHNTQCSFSAGEVWGTEFVLDMCRFEEFLRSLGVVFVIIAQAGAVFIVIRGLK